MEELLDLVHLPGFADRPVAKLSGGQRQRVAIARALALSPKLFLLDEPLSALDAKLREAMQVELRQLQQRLGITTIVVTHDQREAMTMADLVVVMGEGASARRLADRNLPQAGRRLRRRLHRLDQPAAGRRPTPGQGLRPRGTPFPAWRSEGDQATVSVRPEDVHLGAGRSGAIDRPHPSCATSAHSIETFVDAGDPDRRGDLAARARRTSRWAIGRVAAADPEACRGAGKG